MLSYACINNILEAKELGNLSGSRTLNNFVDSTGLQSLAAMYQAYPVTQLLYFVDVCLLYTSPSPRDRG